ncbi:MAG: hypothetical protein ACSLE1_03165 [Sphingobium sp.]
MTALERLEAVSKTRALSEDEVRRMHYLLKASMMTPEQRERARILRLQRYATRKAGLNAKRRQQYAVNWVHAEARRYHCRASYGRKIRAQ